MGMRARRQGKRQRTIAKNVEVHYFSNQLIGVALNTVAGTVTQICPPALGTLPRNRQGLSIDLLSARIIATIIFPASTVAQTIYTPIRVILFNDKNGNVAGAPTPGDRVLGEANKNGAASGALLNPFMFQNMRNSSFIQIIKDEKIVVAPFSMNVTTGLVSAQEQLNKIDSSFLFQWDVNLVNLGLTTKFDPSTGNLTTNALQLLILGFAGCVATINVGYNVFFNV